MKHIVWKAYWNFEKEERFLNDMAAKGLALVSYTWCRYVFEDAEPGKYIYRIELLEQSITHPESQRYLKFMEDTGVEFVDSYLRWVYFRKKASEGEFDIYSDIDSKIIHLKRIRALFMGVMLLNYFPGFSNLGIGIDVYLERGISASLIMSLLNLTLAFGLLLFLVLPLTRRISRLKNDKMIHE